MDPIAKITRCVCQDCQVQRCRKDKCSLSLDGAPVRRVVIDMDCKAMQKLTPQKRCDYLFFGKKRDGERGAVSLVVPIELKSGAFSAMEVITQLQGGADTAGALLPEQIQFELIPVLAHGNKRTHKIELKKLRSKTIKLRGQEKNATLGRCGERLVDVLARGVV